MALSFQYRSAVKSSRVAIMPGAWNPPTIAHIAVARAARVWADEVVLIVPRSFPHKTFEGASLQNRLQMLCTIAAAEPGISVATSDGGLYLDMANETTDSIGPGVDIGLVCGRDAVERIASWDYGRPGVFEELAGRFTFLVAGRAGEYVPAAHHVERMVQLTLDASYDGISSSEIRRRIAMGEPWHDLVPGCIIPRVKELYIPDMP